MRTLALALSTALLGTGCFIDADDDDCLPSTITVEWSTFTAGDGARLGCAAAGVEWVDIFMNDTPVLEGGWSCADGGALITGVAPGTYRITVEGVEASGRIAFRDEQTVSASSCGGRLVRAAPAEGVVEVEYAFAPTNQCVGDYLWFSVFDEIAGFTTAAVDGASPLADQRLYACGSPVVFPLPWGPHSLDWMQEMVEGPAGVFSVTGAQCNGTSFTVPAGGTVGVPVVMTDASVPCL